jgi:polysaccharide export outer membrane protein
VILLPLILVLSFSAQQTASPPPPAAPNDARYTYVLGPEDQITIRVLDAEEIDSKPVHIDSGGFIRLPLVGNIRASGLTVDQLETELIRQLKTYIKGPQVSVSVTEFRSQPVSVLGAVKNPGVHQVQGHKTLLEMLSMAGGIDPEAGHSIKVTRRREYGPIPLESAVPDASGDYSVADIDLASILEARNPKENIDIKPYDVITVPRGQLVYVMGQVRRPGGFVLRQQESLSVLQALALAEGLDRAAVPQNARILRAVNGAAGRSEISVDLKKILAGKNNDVHLIPNDILFIPSSTSRRAIFRGLESALQVATGVAIYRLP